MSQVAAVEAILAGGLLRLGAAVLGVLPGTPLGAAESSDELRFLGEKKRGRDWGGGSFTRSPLKAAASLHRFRSPRRAPGQPAWGPKQALGSPHPSLRREDLPPLPPPDGSLTTSSAQRVRSFWGSLQQASVMFWIKAGLSLLESSTERGIPHSGF